MRRRVFSAAGWIAGWLINPSTAFAVVIGVVGLIGAALSDLPPVVIGLIGLVALTVGLAFVRLVVSLLEHRASRKQTEADYSPEGRRKQLDGRYTHVDPRRELGESCATLAMKIRVFEEVDLEARPVLLQKMMREFLDANPDLGREEAWAKVEANADLRLIAGYQADLRDEALKLFDAARKQEAVVAKWRSTVERPNASDLRGLAEMFRAIARHLGCDVAEPGPETRLQQWARERLAAADEIERECRVGPSRDAYYLEAMQKWDLENLEQLGEVREDLIPSYRENSQTGEKEPGPRVTEEDGRRSIAPGEWQRYYDARIAWLRKTLTDFQGAVVA